MNKTEWTYWLRTQQPVLDQIIAGAADKFYNLHRIKDNFSYDISCCQKESYNLSAGKDLCYDRLATPLSYSLWYQGRRINTFLSHFLGDLMTMGDHDKLDIFDLGAGTGAVQMCLGLIYHKLREDGKAVPELKIYNVDTSPFMLSYNLEFLWPEFLTQYPHAKEIYTEYHVNSWNIPKKLALNNPWISASYLFDISDDKDQIKNDFLALIKDFKPSLLFLLTSHQHAKEELLKTLKNELARQGWFTDSKIKITDQLLFSGSLTEVNQIRNKLSEPMGDKSLGKESFWEDKSFISAKIVKEQQVFGFEMNIPVNGINLHNQPLKIRKDIQLSPDQLNAAKHSGRPAVIIGPAGCGKSVVITERMINIIKDNPDKHIDILLTTFNKDLLKKITEWMESLLKKHYYSYITSPDENADHMPNGSCTIKSLADRFTLRFVNFDMLPKYAGGIPNAPFYPYQHQTILRRKIECVIRKHNLNQDAYQDILSTDFLLEEYHRVIYGLQCHINKGLDHYQNISRKGRGSNPSLSKGLRRQYVWECLSLYEEEIRAQHLQSFISRRQTLLSRIEDGLVEHQFDYVLIDEFQDFTEADFQICFGLVKDVNNLVIGGDIAQSIHIGRSANIPRAEMMASRDFYRLKGSYRLPQRISECLAPLSSMIKQSSANAEGMEEITPYKGSPPGARPIIVYGTTAELLAEKIESIFGVYKIYEFTALTILEKNKLLKELLVEKQLQAETNTIMKLKGLEKDCVVWSTDVQVEFEKEVKEFVYTILTRTSCILIIALSDHTHESYKPIFSLLQQDRLIFWDKESELKFHENTRKYIMTDQEEDETLEEADQV